MSTETGMQPKAEGASAAPTAKASNPKRRPLKSVQDAEIEKVLVSGEEVVLRAKLHGAIYWKSIAVLILAVILWFYVSVLGVLLAVVGAIMLCIAILTQHFLILAITNKRVLARYGLLQMDVVDIRLSKIESIDLERMLPGHMFGYANVVVMGTGQRLIRVSYIGNADEFRKYYNEMVLADEGNEEAEAEVRQQKEQKEKKNQRRGKKSL
ncbi:MAG: PH domain-containing protein [Alphaproteobacteria bacterium]